MFAKVQVGFIKIGGYWVAGSSGVRSFFPERMNSMSVYSVKGKGWRYDFTHRGTRHTEAWFKTKNEAKMAEAKRKEGLLNPQTVMFTEAQNPVVTQAQTTPTDITFLELVNRRLDHVKAYNSPRHYKEYIYLARRWCLNWAQYECSQITKEIVERFVIERRRVSPDTANKEIRYLKATFNFGIKRGYIDNNPMQGISFFPEERKIKYVPPPEDIIKVIEQAERDVQEYLWTLWETMARVNEINSLTWDDVNLGDRTLVLYTRKKKGGHRTPRKIPMTQQLYKIFSRRHENRDKTIPWVFYHTYWSSKTGEKRVGPFVDRKRIMTTLCRKAEVKYFRFHALRHSGASILENSNVPIVVTQKLLGHENRTTTEIYLHSIGNAERVAIRALEEAKKNLTQSLTQENKRVKPFSLTP